MRLFLPTQITQDSDDWERRRSEMMLYAQDDRFQFVELTPTGKRTITSLFLNNDQWSLSGAFEADGPLDKPIVSLIPGYLWRPSVMTPSARI